VTLAELFEMLSYDELQNLSISAEGNGGIIASAQPRIVNYLNEALLKLYSRFVLKENDILVQMFDSVTFYHLIPPFAVTFVPGVGQDNERVRYILDLPDEPFTGGIIKILSVFNSEDALELPLNDESERFSVFTPQAHVLQVPNPIHGRVLNVRYQQRHDKIQGELDENIWIPDVLLGALTSYIAYKVFSHINTVPSTAKSQEFMATYEAFCTEVVDRDLVNSSISQSNLRFGRGGLR